MLKFRNAWEKSGFSLILLAGLLGGCAKDEAAVENVNAESQEVDNTQTAENTNENISNENLGETNTQESNINEFGNQNEASPDTASADSGLGQTIEENPFANPAGEDLASAGNEVSEANSVPTETLPSAVAADAATTSSGGGAVMGLAGTSAGEGLPELGSKMMYFVKKGDSLAKIAKTIFGDVSMYQELAALSGIQDPSKIFPGDVIYYQLTPESQAFAANYEGMGKLETSPQAGETLENVSKRLYGTSAYWKTLWRMNDSIEDPDMLSPGAPLVYPAPALFAAADLSKISETDIQVRLKKVSKKLGKRILS